MSELEVKDLLGIEWRFSEWILHAGGLNSQNVMEYFSLSPFWDPNSNNAVLKMQTQFNALQNERMDLVHMVGIEFALVYEKAPEYFVIAKRRRYNPSRCINLSFYYILNGNIYQAPPLTLLQTSLKEVEEGFNEISSQVEYSTFKGYTWKDSSSELGTKKDEDGKFLYVKSLPSFVVVICFSSNV
ncbi:hypothetical protein BB560_003051 [Smittium megazygosporum]|uniref:Mediator of RNA polymerase II transcription subunit 6 n=1 Tax=Smittium megazygosporum TaxID=133381 RepID=A0A2T9ZD18_9FUNG|nr:hypothetical protein BB560_003051 [Smittium megazygosporum]